MRCKAAHNKKVKDVVGILPFTDTTGRERTYGIADLRYDIKAGRLKLVEKK